MNRFDTALDEYLHLIARVSPWDLSREEPALAAFGEWLGLQEGSTGGLDALDADFVDRYAEHASLTQEQYESLLSALAGLYRWAIRDGRVADNPFAGAYELTRATRKSLFVGAPAPL